ncbi:beta strand repeat-containing protein [Neorhodopirellula pilleata]|nr:hypothetical protein [Neorhodopirellula pilleata]
MKKRSTRNTRRRTRTASTRRTRRIFFESLEQRAMLAADMLFEGTSNDDQIVVRDAATPGMLTIESTNGTFNAVTFEMPTNSLTIKGLGGNDTITVASFNSPFNGDLLLEAEGITVNPGVTISTTGKITLTAKAEDDGKIEPRVNLGLIEVPLPVDLTGFYYANPAALIDLTGATLVGTAITLSADASAPINAAPAQFNAFEGTGVYVKSKAEIKIVNTTVTADSLSAIATSSVSSDQEDKADGTVATGDAGISVAVVDSDALAYVTGTSTLTISGNVNIESVNTIGIQSSVDGGATGTVGATLAVAVVGADTRSYISGSSSIADGADSVTITATTNSTATSSATSTAGGAEENTTPGQSKTQKVLSDPDGDGNTEDKASTGDGDIKFAGAVAVTVVNNDTLAYIDTSGSIGSEGKVTVTSAATDNASATASGENTGGGATGVGVAVALNIVHVDSNAYLAGTGSLKAAETIDVSASLGVVEGFSASATSGAGASDKVGVAGSLAINVVNTNVNAVVKTGATLTLSGGLTLTSTSTTNTQTNADAQQEAAGTTGIGASIALGIGNNDTNALVEDNANFTGASSLSLSASGAHAMSTESTAGAEGGTAVTPVVAISVALNDTVARLGTGVAMTVDGDVTIEATQENESTANAEASATGDTAIGASLGLTVAEDSVSATLMRNLTTLGGSLALMGRGAAATRTTAKAGAKGAEEEDETTPADDDQVNQENDKQLAFANKRSEMATGEKSKQTQTPKAETADENGDGKSDSLSVAAAIAVNIHDATSTATIPDGLTLVIDGNVTVSTGANSDASALADGSAVSGEGGTSVGAAVALNVGQTVNDATVGNAAITSDGLVIEALMTDREISITPTSTATADIERDSILVGELDDLAVGDEVIYSNGGGSSIGGLSNNTTYFVVSLEDGRIQLATAADGDAIDLTSVGTGDKHKLDRAEKDAIEFNPAEENFAIELGGGTGLETGDAIVYGKGDGAVIGGLTDGETYYAIVDGSGKLALASSYDEALEGNAVELTSVGSGEEHTITEATHSAGASATSGASGGNIGVAGSLAINVTDGSTQAILKSGAGVTLRDGSDAGTTVGDVALAAKATTNNRVLATPSEDASGASLGVGLSVGVNVGDHDATAKIEGNTTITTANNLTLEAVGIHFMVTDAKSGASSEKTAAAGAVATTISDNDTTAMVTSGGAALDVRGDVLVSADGSHTQNTTADGQTAGAGAGIGLSLLWESWRTTFWPRWIAVFQPERLQQRVTLPSKPTRLLRWQPKRALGLKVPRIRRKQRTPPMHRRHAKPDSQKSVAACPIALISVLRPQVIESMMRTPKQVRKPRIPAAQALPVRTPPAPMRPPKRKAARSRLPPRSEPACCSPRSLRELPMGLRSARAAMSKSPRWQTPMRRR